MSTPYPHLTSTTSPPLPASIVAAYQRIFYARVVAGEIKPFVLPYHLYGLIPLTVYLCIPKAKKSPWLKWLVWGMLWYWQIKNIRETGSRSVTNGFAAGLISAWGMVWTGVWVWWKDAEGMRRVRRRRRREGREQRVERDAVRENGSVSAEGRVLNDEKWTSTGSTTMEQNGSLNGSQNGSARNRKEQDTAEKTNQEVSNGHTKAPQVIQDEEYEYYWQPYPAKLSERIPWVLDLVLNFRGPGWSWAIPPLSPLSSTFKTANGKPLYPSSSKGPKYARKTFLTRTELARYRIPIFLTCYLAIDIVKTIMMYDPYFLFGPTTYALPPHLSHLSPFVLDFYRKSLCTAGILISIELILSLPAISTLLLPPSSQTHLILTPPYYPSTWGPLTCLTSTGLRGLWGTWWHQTFRYGFSAPYEWALSTHLIKPHSLSSRSLALICAFSISGFLHAAGSHTQTAHTKPMSPFFFFILQGLGILIQSSFCTYFKKHIRNEKIVPIWVRKTGNVLFVLVWLWGTGNWLLDDFARSGVWLYEPVPVSIVRGLGWGIENSGKGNGWGVHWSWEAFWVGMRWEPLDIRWYSGRRWWESGLAI